MAASKTERGSIMKSIIAAGTLALVLTSPWAQAQSGAPLLDLTLYGQLERWLGAGRLDLQNLYTRRAGDDSLDFHAAVDGRGPTFTLLEVSNAGGERWIIGGYNPQSWSSTDGWHVTERSWQRTAFLFNYTDPRVWRQVPPSDILPSRGARQTYNVADHGPTFGAGPDLLVNDRLDTALSWQVTYGVAETEGRSIIDLSTGGRLFQVNALEMYSVAVVPEPATTAMLAAGLGVLGWAAQRRRRPQ